MFEFWRVSASTYLEVLKQKNEVDPYCYCMQKLFVLNSWHGCGMAAFEVKHEIKVLYVDFLNEIKIMKPFLDSTEQMNIISITHW